MNPIINALDQFVANARAAEKISDEDYFDEEGLLCCGSCHCRKQMHIEWVNERDIVVPIMCKCKENAYRLEEEQKQFRERQQMIDTLRMNSLMDRRFDSCSFTNTVVNDDNRTALAICKKYAMKFDTFLAKNQGLLLWGSPSTGKTHAACCIANEVMKGLHPVISTSFVTLLENARGLNDNTIEMFKAKARTADLMIADDLGAERDTDFAAEIVYNIIDSRYKSMKPIIITTNLSLDEIVKTTDMRRKRTYERILEICYPIHFYGKSWRMKEATSRFNEMKKLLEE